MSENTEQRQSACPVWIWFVLLLGLVLLYLLYQHAITKKSLWIQEDIQTRAMQNLHIENDLKSVITVADGRDITLSGDVTTQTALTKAEQIAQQTPGVRLVNNQLVLQTQPAEPATEETPTPALDNAVDEPSSEQTIQTTVTSSAKVEPMPEEFAPLEETVEVVTTQVQQVTDKIPSEITQAKNTQQRLSQLDFSNITFEKNSAALTEHARTTLDEVTSALLENPKVHIRVEGHTDTSGNPDLNLKLSKQRANSVLDYFVNAGIDNARIEADGYGDQFPIAPNDTKAGRIKNRRIEIKVKNGE